MINDGSFQIRKSPLNPKFLEYLKITDSAEQKIKRSQAVGTFGNTKVKKDEFAALQESIRAQQLSDEMLATGLCAHGDAQVAAIAATLAYEDTEDADGASEADDGRTQFLMS